MNHGTYVFAFLLQIIAVPSTESVFSTTSEVISGFVDAMLISFNEDSNLPFIQGNKSFSFLFTIKNILNSLNVPVPVVHVFAICSARNNPSTAITHMKTKH